MAILVDTGALELLRRRVKNVEQLALRFFPPVICSHVAAEFLYGQLSARVSSSALLQAQEFLETRTKVFALAVIAAVGSLRKGKASDVLGYQLLKSGTSIGANYREANRAQSHDDFIHKIAICEKEAAETEYWLELIIGAGIAPPHGCDNLLCEARELLAIFVASGRTAKSRW